jgi:hypothetical protein
MNKQLSILSAAILALSVSASASADTVAQWDFETATPADVNNTATYPNAIAPTIGFGNALGVHANAGTDWSTPVGNGSANSFSSNTWAVGDYYQFQTSTTGYADVMLSWDQTSSSTGPKDFKLSYSTNGTAFTDFASYVVLVNASPTAWTSSTSYPVYNFTYDLSSVTALDNQASVYFRLTDTSTTAVNGATVATSGTDRVDNFTVSATAISAPIPEADTYAFMALGMGLVGFLARRRKI